MLHSEFVGLRPSITYDLVSTLLGDRIGSGIHREVYELALDPQRFVVKVHNVPAATANSTEWALWEQCKDTAFGKRWLAPCEYLSVNGQVLVQRRTVPVAKAHMPKKVPAVFTDLKIENWGLLDGRIVCHDYAMMLLKFPGQLRPAKWWSTSER